MRASLEAHVQARGFPCVGAKSALSTGRLKIATAWQLTSAWNDVAIHDALLGWSRDYAADREGLRSFAVVFSGPLDLDEHAFERAMWERLQSFAAKDGWRGQHYAPQVSSDPADPHFSLSFGGEAYFIVGMHPNASRPARRTPYPTLVFNLHDQFERLRERQRYERMREAILTRDRDLAGSINPMLARHGESSEARQYSGRAVGDDWRCPFSDPRSKEAGAP
ncbi:guanitoxin biosynthesis heme-dependent pre-guanitoxin N-hydroxylase GntA [Aurantiacibacter luteus]|uniref:guanitoxin biosynthesis heme-dependent pre-guanitoxin N-hydroxylase GntA n=1 Tax=Aurantiacibacter luteus TaxID=1581420 RepID=UPI00165185B1|nr:guanitoxin biosynthesis heme-dependent pre-guanitoxin N-hydroxylase GntA [Aurantiacibacter luteus]